ncbi:MAG TPA: sulfite exporter TauE/SafE family protein [Bacteroidota bacterium]|nr:sulfite exporter TauE/SafE family protein [Bacteroidota bacterium]
MLQSSLFVVLGLVVGVLAGLLGIGGAIFVVPVLVYAFGWEQHMAQGTTLAMLVPPIGILAAWKYYQAGHADLKVAALLCAGFFIGGYFGGDFANRLSGEALRKIFGGIMLLISLKMIFWK